MLTANERQSMKNLNKVLLAAAVAATVGLATNASAQYKPVGDDGIAASPKVRQMLNETESRTTVPAAPAVAVNHTRPADDGITASPKGRAQLNERSNNAIQIAP